MGPIEVMPSTVSGANVSGANFKPMSRHDQYFAKNRLVLEEADQGPTKPSERPTEFTSMTGLSSRSSSYIRPTSVNPLDWTFHELPSSRDTNDSLDNSGKTPDSFNTFGSSKDTKTLIPPWAE